MIKKLSIHSYKLFALSFLLASFLLLPVPLDPDVHFSTCALLGVISTFIAWNMALISVGQFLGNLYLQRTSAQKCPLFLGFALGSAAAVFIVATAGCLGLLGYQKSFFYQSLVVSAICFLPSPFEITGFKARFKKWRSLVHQQEYWPFIPIVLTLGSLCVVSFIQALLAHGYSDPVLYHLVGPRLWTDAGKIYFDQSYPYSYHAVYWEYLYVWGSLLLGQPEGLGLIETQIFSQLAHVMIGSVGTGLALHYFLDQTFVQMESGKKLPWQKSTQQIWILLSITAIYSAEALINLAWHAKNDWGILFWTVAGSATLLIPAHPKSRSTEPFTDPLFIREITAGLFFALALCTKPTALFAILSFGIFALIVVYSAAPSMKSTPGWTKGQNFLSSRAKSIFFGQKITVLVLAGGFFSLPILIRNYLGTSNPFHPYLMSSFPQTPLPNEMKLYLMKFVPHITFDIPYLLSRCQEAFFDTKVSWGLIALPWALLQHHRYPRLRTWSAILLFCLVPFIFLRVPNGFLRWAGWGLLLLPMVSIMTLATLTNALPRLWKNWGILGVTTMVSFLAYPTYLPRAIKTLVTAPSADQIIRSKVHLGGAAKAWLRLNIKSGERAFTTGDNQLYYVLHKHVTAVGEDQEFAVAIQEFESTGDFSKLIQQTKMKYLLDSKYWDKGVWNSFAGYIHELVQKYPEVIIFQSPDSIVVDAEKLAKRHPGKPISLPR